jgi:hypothetical protein
VLTAYGSYHIPFLASHAVRVLFGYVVPGLGFALWLAFYFLVPIRGRILAARVLEVGKAWGYSPTHIRLLMTVGALFFLISLSYVFRTLLSLPTKEFAEAPVKFETNVLGTYRSSLSQVTQITIADQDGGTSVFVWPSSDIRAKHVKDGDTIRISGRAWALGMYIESLELVR